MADMPQIAACWKGPGNREWYLAPGAPPVDDLGAQTEASASGDTGTQSQSRLYCRVWRAFINPNGFACDLCAAQTWPNVVHWRAHILPTLVKRDTLRAQDALVAAVARGTLTEEEGLQLAAEFFPS